VLDEVGERVDHARDQDLVVVQDAAFEATILVGPMWMFSIRTALR
jgi:hypothetical protein